MTDADADYGTDSPQLDEKHLPAWLVQQAVGDAIDENVVGIESNGDHTYSVLIERERDGSPDYSEFLPQQEMVDQ